MGAPKTIRIPVEIKKRRTVRFRWVTPTNVLLAAILATLLYGAFGPVRVEAHWADPDAGSTCYVVRAPLSIAIDCDDSTFYDGRE